MTRSAHAEYLSQQAAQRLGKLHHDHPHENDPPLSPLKDTPVYGPEGCPVHIDEANLIFCTILHIQIW